MKRYAANPDSNLQQEQNKKSKKGPKDYKNIQLRLLETNFQFFSKNDYYLQIFIAIDFSIVFKKTIQVHWVNDKAVGSMKFLFA